MNRPSGIYMRRSDVIDVIVITRRHVGGILSVNTDEVKMRKYENSCSKVIFRPRISTGVQFHTQQLASIRKLMTLHC